KAHEDIWQHLGNKPGAPKAFMQDGYMRVDVERYALEDGKWSEKKLKEIGLDLKNPKLPSTPGPGGGSPPTSQEPGSGPDGDALQKRADEYSKKMDELNKRLENLRAKQSGSKPVSPGEDLEKEGKAIQAELEALNKEAEAIASKLVQASELE